MATVTLTQENFEQTVSAGGIVLVDYKTDFVLKGQEELLKERYRAQFHYYSRALEQMFGRPVKEQILYSFQLGEIPVESAISSFN